MQALTKVDHRTIGLCHLKHYAVLWSTSVRRRNSLTGISRRAKSHSQAIQRKFNMDEVRLPNHEVLGASDIVQRYLSSQSTLQ